MAATSTCTDSLANIPDNISENFLPHCENLSRRALDKGLNYYTQGYIHNIRVFDAQPSVQVSARCWRSMRKNEEPHKLRIEISQQRDKITEPYCSCKVGLYGHCSHIVGLIKSLKGFKLHNYKRIPDQLSCTSVPQQWNVPRGPKIQPVPIGNVVVARPTDDRKRTPILCQIDTNYKLPKLTITSLNHLKMTKGTPLEYIVSSEAPVVDTLLGPVQLGSALSYQTRNLEIRKPAISTGCGDLSVNGTPPVQLDVEFKQLNSGYHVDNPSSLETQTRRQADCSLWFSVRKNRLTASSFAEVIKRKSPPTEKFLDRLFNNKSISAPSLDYGKRNESKAKEKYLKKFTNRHLHECGFVVSNQFPFLGATPDGKVCDSGNCGIIEIKCPYSARDLTVSEACDKVKDFCLQKIQNSISLREDHGHYTQVQGQLMLSGSDYCDFILYTPNESDLFVQRIYPNVPFMRLMLNKLANFFKSYALPYFLKNKKED